MKQKPRKPWVLFPTLLSYTTAELKSWCPKTRVLQLQSTNTTAGFSLFLWVFSSHSRCFPPVFLLQLGSEAGGRSPPPSRYANTPFFFFPLPSLPRFPAALMVGLEGTAYMGVKGAGCWEKCFDLFYVPFSNRILELWGTCVKINNS